MNKLASIFYLRKLGLPTIYPRIVMFRNEKEIRKFVDCFYYDCDGWVLRCGRLPYMGDKMEGQLPWDIAYSRDELTEKIIKLQGKVGNFYYVFCHEVKEMVKGGVMLIEGNKILIEAGFGEPKELSAMFRGKRDPEQRVVLSPGMLSFRDYSGEPVLTVSDLCELRNVERIINWEDISALTQPVSVEFSRLARGSFYVHDIGVSG
ncbi:hypothetical protein GF386_03510 [Candidatus Pacearchaeota archaeon]|nr:hypothetical protein [Candidatus Pacearchaeota archaeon]MBD3283218.1 hypothetical protein [Candidatus Pacearchaeota archaeon]